ncbi:hypothetical protein PYCC9005_005843 [Savitreella phatthalungensis]
MKYSITTFLSRQFFSSLAETKADLSGKTVIVTGATPGGLGHETARLLGRMKPAKLIITVRNEAKGKEAIADLKRTDPDINVEAWSLELDSFASVKSFGDRLNKLDRLDIIVENAAVIQPKRQETGDGWEVGLQVNVISTTLLSVLALPKMRETVKKHDTEARIVIVGSEVHHWAKLSQKNAENILDAMNKETDLEDRYNCTKLLNLFVTRQLATYLKTSPNKEDDRIYVCVPNPGLCHSGLARNMGSLAFSIIKLMIARRTDYGARNLTYAAVADIGSQESGGYIADCHFEEPSDFVLSKAGQKAQLKVWNEQLDIFKTVCPKALEILN